MIGQSNASCWAVIRCVETIGCRNNAAFAICSVWFQVRNSSTVAIESKDRYRPVVDEVHANLINPVIPEIHDEGLTVLINVDGGRPIGSLAGAVDLTSRPA